MTLTTLNQHIEITPGIAGGKPRIAGHRITVQNIANWHERLGKSADEIATEYDLTLADVYAARITSITVRKLIAALRKVTHLWKPYASKHPQNCNRSCEHKVYVATIKFYMDEHVAKAIVNGLRQRGVDVLSAVDAELLGTPDEEHLARARSESRVLFTQDDDVLRLHAADEEHAGIVYAPQETSVGDIIRGLMLVHQVLMRKICCRTWSSCRCCDNLIS